MYMHNRVNVSFVNKASGKRRGKEKSLLAKYVTCFKFEKVLYSFFPSFLSPVYRGFWTVLMLLGVLTIVMASFFIICAAPFASHILYKAGGGFFIIAGGYTVWSVN